MVYGVSRAVLRFTPTSSPLAQASRWPPSKARSASETSLRLRPTCSCGAMDLHTNSRCPHTPIYGGVLKQPDKQRDVITATASLHTSLQPRFPFSPGGATVTPHRREHQAYPIESSPPAVTRQDPPAHSQTVAERRFGWHRPPHPLGGRLAPLWERARAKAH